MSKYWKEGLPRSIKRSDTQAFKILEKIFPERKIVQLDTTAVAMGGGNLHCITNNQPKSKTVQFS